MDDCRKHLVAQVGEEAVLTASHNYIQLHHSAEENATDIDCVFFYFFLYSFVLRDVF